MMVNGAGSTLIEMAPTTNWLDVSDTCAPNEYAPVVVGVPVMLPEESRLRPGGSVPPLCDHVYGLTPPVALSEPE